MSLTPELAVIHEEIKQVVKIYRLDCFEVVFELIDAKQINEIAAYGGFPTRYPHWKWGMAYEQLSKTYEWGYSKIYEMVINTDPCYAYLMRANNLVDQKTVMAHVYAHCDFFKNNFYFSRTNRKMLDQMANHATVVRRLIDKLGVEEVESFIDICLSVENLIDVHQHDFPYRRGYSDFKSEELKKVDVPRLKSKPYMDKYINPAEFLEDQKKKVIEQKLESKKIPAKPERDILKFIIDYANLDDWKKDVLNIIRDESYYFAPQTQTKIMNEGWASYWHSKIMTQKIAKDMEIIDYADAYSSVMATSPGQINPYKIGVELFKHIEDRWNKGKFGLEYINCDDYAKKRDWNTETGLGREKIFEVRSFYNDVNFIDEFLDEEFAHQQKLYEYAQDPKTGNVVIVSKDYQKVKKRLLEQLTNGGNPIIEVVDGNYKNRSQLLLVHKYLGVEIKLDYAHQVLINLEKLWTRPISLETTINGKKIIINCENGKISEEVMGKSA